MSTQGKDFITIVISSTKIWQCKDKVYINLGRFAGELCRYFAEKGKRSKRKLVKRDIEQI